MDNTMMLFCTLLSLLVYVIKPTVGHPQCLDFRPPFEAADVTFCAEYADFGCCTAEDDDAIRKRHYRVVSDLEHKIEVEGCREKLKEILCLECNPYAAHIYDAEATLIQSHFPGLCGDFCNDFYDSCYQAVPLLTEDEDTRISAESKELFCEHNAAPDPTYCYPDLNSNPELAYNISIEGRTTEGCVCLEEFASGFQNPLLLRVPPDGTQRMFIAEQIGLVHVFYPNKTRLPDPFMNFSSIVHVSNRRGDEKGFLGLAFHPQFADNRRLFVYYSISHEGKHKTRLSEFLQDSDNVNKIQNDSERVLFDVPQPYDNHNGGELLFGLDGYLYLFLGDGGAGGDPHGYAQNRSTLLGKVLRLDVDSPPVAGAEYTVPLDNPFIEVPGALPEIYAYGIRNIWRCDLDEGDIITGHGRGRIICGDVGQNAYEEVDIIKKGGNYGWNAREGFECYDDDLCGNIGPEELPIYAYPHADGKSVTGGHVYRGCQNPNLEGKYIFGDFMKGKLWTLEEDLNTGTWSRSDLDTCGPDICFNGLVGNYENYILSFGEDADGEVYLLTTSNPSPGSTAGKVYKFVDPRRRGDPTLCRTYVEPTVSAEDTTLSQKDTTSQRSSAKPPATSHGSSLNGLYVTTCVFLPIMQCFTALL